MVVGSQLVLFFIVCFTWLQFACVLSMVLLQPLFSSFFVLTTWLSWLRCFIDDLCITWKVSLINAVLGMLVQDLDMFHQVLCLFHSLRLYYIVNGFNQFFEPSPRKQWLTVYRGLQVLGADHF